MTTIPRLVGMVHLAPLPGSPRFAGSMEATVDRALADASALAESGFPCLLVENYGDVPFHAGAVPAVTVAAMTRALSEVVEATGLPVGVNVLRNDPLSALAVAAVTGAAFIRVNVLVGIMYTDQGPIVGDAARVARTRAALCPAVDIWADVMVKHATPPAGTDPARLARDTVERGLADALIVSGSGTGQTVDPALGAAMRGAVPGNIRVVIGSGATPESLSGLLEFADTVIVGSYLKEGGDPRNPIEPDRAARMAAAARAHGLI